MAFSENRLHGFKQDVYRRVQMAAAVHVIKNTPTGKSPEAHAVDIQQKLKLRWLNSAPSQSGDLALHMCIDQHVLRQQQDALKLRLHSVVPQNSQPLFQDNSLDLEDAAMTEAAPVSNKAHLYYQHFKRDKCEVLANANFIQAIIHLEALAKTQSTVPIQQYVGSISKMGNKFNVSLDPVVKRAAPEEAFSTDSGFYNCEEHHSSEVSAQGTSSKSVASSMLLYIISSCNADQLLEKSIQAILNQFKKLLCGNEMAWRASNLQEIMDHWTGSIYQQTIEVLSAIICGQTVLSDIIASSTKMCFCFLTEMVDIIAKKDSPNEIRFETEENQIMMVLQLSEGTNLWFPTLEFIFNTVADLATKIKRGLDETTKSCGLGRTRGSVHERHKDTQLMDQCFFLFRLLRAFLTSRHAQPQETKGVVCNSKPTANPTAHRSVAGLWRKHYEVQDERTVENSCASFRIGPTKSNVRCWKKILEKPLNDLLYKNPLVAVIIYDCVQLLPSLHQ